MSAHQLNRHKYEQIKVSDLIDYERNARTHSEEQIEQVVESINQFGFTNPVLIDENNIIIAGHGRTAAARLLNIEKIPAIRLNNLSEVQIKALRIADNQIALNAGWDNELLASELEEINLEDFNLDVMGFDAEFLDSLLTSELDLNESEVYEEVIPEEPKEYRVKKGDVWILGNHRLICGDSTDKGTILKLMNGSIADLYITDPPYNVNYSGGTKDKLTISNDNLTDAEFNEFLYDSFTAANNVMKDGCPFYIWHASKEVKTFYDSIYRIEEWNSKQYLLWIKNHFVMGRQDYHWKHEPCIYGWKNGAHYFIDDRTQTTILEYDKPNKSIEHPTMKPLPLFERLIINSSKENDSVLDSFGGSGTTLIACEKLGRKAFLCELEEKYCDVIIERWENLTGEKAYKLTTNIKTEVI